MSDLTAVSPQLFAWPVEYSRSAPSAASLSSPPATVVPLADIGVGLPPTFLMQDIQNDF
jgi:hypothetical protein